MAFNVILDVDTGVDDALAILYATRHPDVSVLGITCVDGNPILRRCVTTPSKSSMLRERRPFLWQPVPRRP